MGEVPPLKVKAENGLVRILKAEAVEAMGEYAERVEDPDEIAPALKRAFKKNRSGRPAYIEVICCQYPVYGMWIRGG